MNKILQSGDNGFKLKQENRFDSTFIASNNRSIKLQNNININKSLARYFFTSLDSSSSFYTATLPPLYMSQMSLSSGIPWMVPLKKSSSMACPDTDLRAGSRSKSFPKRDG